MARFIKAILFILGCLVGFDIAGAIVCFIVEVLGFEFKALYFTIWFVAGVFCGLIAYDMAGRVLSNKPEDKVDWSNTSESGRIGITVLIITALTLVALSVLFKKIFWVGSPIEGGYSPDGMAMTLTYFITIVGAMVLGHFVFRPGASKKG